MNINESLQEVHIIKARPCKEEEFLDTLVRELKSFDCYSGHVMLMQEIGKALEILRRRIDEISN